MQTTTGWHRKCAHFALILLTVLNCFGCNEARASALAQVRFPARQMIRPLLPNILKSKSNANGQLQELLGRDGLNRKANLAANFSAALKQTRTALTFVQAKRATFAALGEQCSHSPPTSADTTTSTTSDISKPSAINISEIINEIARLKEGHAESEALILQAQAIQIKNEASTTTQQALKTDEAVLQSQLKAVSQALAGGIAFLKPGSLADK